MKNKKLHRKLLSFFVAALLLCSAALPHAAEAVESQEDFNPSDFAFTAEDADIEYVPDKVIVRVKQENAGISLFSAFGAKLSPFDGLDILDTEVLAQLPQENPQLLISGERRSMSLRTDEIVLVTLANSGRRYVREAIEILENNQGVVYAEPDYIIRIDEEPNDPYYSNLYAMELIDAPKAWDITTGSAEIIAAVVDTGVDTKHADLNENIWMNPGEIASDGIDNDGNGFIDDINGWNFVSDNNDPYDDHSHGTHVAGTIAAVGNNKVGVTGVSWKTKLMPLKVFDSKGEGRTEDLIEALEYLSKTDVQLVNNSYTFDAHSRAVNDLIDAQRDKVFVAAAGNDGVNIEETPKYPASYTSENVIAVSSTNSADEIAGTSNYGRESVDLAAPGVSIYSTVPGGRYGTKSGTSMATPHVTGALALMLTKDITLSPSELKDALLISTEPIPQLDWETVSGGRLNVGDALLINPQYADAESIMLNASSLTMKTNGRMKLTASIFPLPAKDPRILWTSDNASVIEVSVNGEIRAAGEEGTATVRAYSASKSEIYGECEIIVSGSPTEIVFEDHAFKQGVIDALNTSECLSADYVGLHDPKQYVDYTVDDAIYIEDALKLEKLALLPQNIGGRITSLSGLEHFANLKELIIENTGIEALDVRNLHSLEVLDVSGNSVRSLSFDTSAAWKRIDISDNLLNIKALSESGILSAVAASPQASFSVFPQREIRGTADEPIFLETRDDLLFLSSATNSADDGIRRNLLPLSYSLLPENGEYIDMENIPFAPIGNNADAFTGSFDGGNYVISNLRVSTETPIAGMFAAIGETGSVSNLKLRNVLLEADIAAGAITGRNNGTLENCHVSGEISAQSIAGGIAGMNTGTIKSSSSTVEFAVKSDNDNLAISLNAGFGGIVGKNVTGTIEDCFSTGEITGDSEMVDAGGIAGENAGGVIRTSLSTMSIPANGSNHGGIAGTNTLAMEVTGTIENCVALNEKIAGTSGTGRIVGVNEGILTQNRAWDGVLINDRYVDDDRADPYAHIDGKGIANTELKTQAFWENSEFIFGADSWAWNDEALPYLSAAEALPWPEWINSGRPYAPPEVIIYEPLLPPSDDETASGEEVFAKIEDIDEDKWYYEDVRYVVESGLFKGVSETEFKPENRMKRAMFVTVLGRAAEQMGRSTDGAASAFSDIKAGGYYENYVHWAFSAGIITGINDNKFAPNRDVSREDMIVMLMRFADYIGINLPADNEASFADSGAIASYAEGAIARAAGAGIIDGFSDGSFKPRRGSSRAEVAKILHMFMEMI